MKMLTPLSFFLTLVFLLTHLSFSQLEFAVGIKGGVNSSSLNYDPELYAGKRILIGRKEIEEAFQKAIEGITKMRGRLENIALSASEELKAESESSAS